MPHKPPDGDHSSLRAKISQTACSSLMKTINGFHRFAVLQNLLILGERMSWADRNTDPFRIRTEAGRKNWRRSGNRTTLTGKWMPLSFPNIFRLLLSRSGTSGPQKMFSGDSLLRRADWRLNPAADMKPGYSRVTSRRTGIGRHERSAGVEGRFSRLHPEFLRQRLGRTGPSPAGIGSDR